MKFCAPRRLPPDHPVLICTAARGYTRVDQHAVWDMFWGSPADVQGVLADAGTFSWSAGKAINHWPGMSAATRKDLFALYMAHAQRRTGAASTSSPTQAIIPTFQLPADWRRFKQFAAEAPCWWVIKPIASSQGRGIQLVHGSRMKQLPSLWQGHRSPASARSRTPQAQPDSDSTATLAPSAPGLSPAAVPLAAPPMPPSYALSSALAQAAGPSTSHSPAATPTSSFRYLRTKQTPTNAPEPSTSTLAHARAQARAAAVRSSAGRLAANAARAGSSTSQRTGQVRQPQAAFPAQAAAGPDPPAPRFVACQYIPPPALLGGCKFDLRVYVLVLGMAPVRAYMYVDGFARVAPAPYQAPTLADTSAAVHLTNTSLAKSHEQFDARHSYKCPLSDMWAALALEHGPARVADAAAQMQQAVLHVLNAVQHKVPSTPGCFELLGIDVLLDGALHPWVLELNASPALSATSEPDRVFKLRLVHAALAAIEVARLGQPAQPRMPELAQWIALGSSPCRTLARELQAAEPPARIRP